ncbi:leucine-rich repeat-containing protein 14-like isoform X1 [Notamacropus eugenii]|uniref:leucine-rich repeat-containing protein 14-like isoform X1 n=2 Tax=Notamacropus eugenii TaxID=9315 RepID=UPI003B66BCD5
MQSISIYFLSYLPLGEMGQGLCNKTFCFIIYICYLTCFNAFPSNQGNINREHVTITSARSEFNFTLVTPKFIKRQPGSSHLPEVQYYLSCVIGGSCPPYSAMRPLVFLCAQQVIKDEESACQALELLPQDLYPVLFKAAFMHGKTLLLQALVHTWPYPILSFKQLLQDRPHCRRALRQDWPHCLRALLQECPNCPRALLQDRPAEELVQAMIMGVKARLEEATDNGTQQSLYRRHPLQLLDMTGLLDYGYEEDLKTMKMWARTMSMAQAGICHLLDKVEQPNESPNKCRKVEDLPCTLLPVEVRVDLWVTPSSSGFLKQALQNNAVSPLRLCCRDFRAEDLPPDITVDLLGLLDHSSLRRLDLSFFTLEAGGVWEIVASIMKFTNLLSLKLQYSNMDVWRLWAMLEGTFSFLASEMSKLKRLKELNLGTSWLSGQLRQLLSGLQCPLESLELPVCYLLPVDLSYLSQSPHAPHLKKLDLSGNNLSGDLLPPFQALLGEASASLLCLKVTECQLMDVHLISTLPLLSRCTRLRYLGLYDNPLSSIGLKALLSRSEVMPDLQLVVYPFPVDCYKDLPGVPLSANLLEDYIDEEKFAQVQGEMHQMLIAAGRADVLWTTDVYGPNMPDYFSL